MKKSILIITVIVLIGCFSEKKSPTTPDLSNLVITDECDDPPILSFNLAPAALIPIEGPDQSFTFLGENAAQAILDDLTSEELFCALKISDETKALFEEVEQLIIDGNKSEARNLLSTLLAAGKLSTKSINKTKHANFYFSNERQKVRELLRAAGYDIEAGGDGGSYTDQARTEYSAWAEGTINNTTSIKELLKIAAEAQLLGIENLSDEAIEKATEIAKQELEEKLKSFDPCTASSEEAGDLLDQLAKEMIFTAEQGDNYERTLKKAGEAFIKNGKNKEAVQQIFGDDIEEPVCSYTFEWTRAVSDGWTFQGEGSSCDGINWEGSVALSGVNSVGASVNSSGEFIFAIAEGTNSANTTVPTNGVMVVDGNALSFNDPLPMIFKFLKDDLHAEITIASDGSGSMPTPIGNIVFASVYTTDPTFTVELAENPDCN